MRKLTVVGGGLGGLVAAITAAERGAAVTLHEARSVLGGRWRTTAPPYVAHDGPHVIYSDGPIWAWLKQRRLLGSTRSVPISALAHFHFRTGGQLKRMPPPALVRTLMSRIQAPVDQSYAEWATGRFGEEAARLSAAATGVGLFYWNPGELSAAFVWERLHRVFSMPPAAGYREGGWGSMLDALGKYARDLGVSIELGSRVSEIGDGITIVATEIESARALLGDTSLDWLSGKVSQLDLGLAADRRDAFVVSDLDESGWLERFTVPDPSIAPAGESLLQLQVPLAPRESRQSGISRIEGLADAALPNWRERVRFRRDAVSNRRTGALDLPGTTWRDRPAIDRGHGVYLVGDRVAAPGLLSEVSFNSAIAAATSAVK